MIYTYVCVRLWYIHESYKQTYNWGPASYHQKSLRNCDSTVSKLWRMTLSDFELSRCIMEVGLPPMINMWKRHHPENTRLLRKIQWWLPPVKRPLANCHPIVMDPPGSSVSGPCTSGEMQVRGNNEDAATFALTSRSIKASERIH